MDDHTKLCAFSAMFPNNSISLNALENE